VKQSVIAVPIPGTLHEIVLVRVRAPPARRPACPVGRGAHAQEEVLPMVARLKRERKEFLNSFPGLEESLVKSLG
jgi:hypothetical protein